MIIKKEFVAKGTTCKSCEKIISAQANKVKGVKQTEFDYLKEAGMVKFDDQVTDIDTILSKIEEKNYTCYILSDNGSQNKNTLAWFFAIIGIVLVGYYLFNIMGGINLPEISQNMGYSLLFLVGLLTGFHCISMCGGFVISYTTKHANEGTSSYKSHLMYGLGKTASYTMIGAVFGLLGSIIAFTPMMRGVVGLFAGIFLVLFGLKMLNIFPILRKIQFRTPKFLNRFVGKNSKGASPLMIGLLNGLMIACGPLQAIYIMAAGTGSMVEGAKLLFVFALGTLPVMLGFGYFTTFVSGKLTHKILKASGAIVMILGLVMVNNGLVLTGTGYDVSSLSGMIFADNDDDLNEVVNLNGGVQEIRMTVDRYGWSPDKFVLKKDVPVRWIIDGKEINGCNNAIQVPQYNLQFDINKGEQIIEFTPHEEGIVRWSCWMGMIPGTFIVKEDIDLDDQNAIKEEVGNVKQAPSGACNGACGSPTCGSNSGGCGCGA